MPNQITNVGFSQPNDYAIELSDIERRKRLAEALQVQGTQASGGTEMVGGWAIPKSPWEGIGKASQQMSGAYQQNQLTERQKEIAQAQRTQGNSDVQGFMQALQGTPAQPEQARQGPLTDDEGNAMPGVAAQPAVAGDRQKALGIALQSQNPMVAGAGQSILADMLKNKEWKLGERFNAQTGKPEKFMYRTDDPSITQAMGGQQGVSSDTQAKLDQAQRHWEGLSAKDQKSLEMDAARLGVSIQEMLIHRSAAANTAAHTSFSSDGAVGVGPPQVSVPQIPQVPAAGAPQAVPQQFGASPLPAWAQGSSLAPNSQGGVFRTNSPPPAQSGSMFRPPAPVAAPAGNAPPRGATEQAIRKDRALKTQEMDVKREFNMGGIGETIDSARAYLSGKGGKLGPDGQRTASPMPTHSLIGEGMDWLGGAVGVSTGAGDMAEKMRSIGGNLVSKMPRMEGPQSDADVKNYKEMAGRIGDPSIPLQRRLEALDEVEALYRKYDKAGAKQPSGASGGWKDL